MTMLDVVRAAAALTVGAAAMYYLDPDGGRRRRALARDRAVSVTSRAGELARIAARRGYNRTKGLAAQGLAHLRPAEPASDGQLHDRIRSRMGRVVSHPRAVHVQVTDAAARLDGDILSDELEGLLSAVAGTPGVREVDNRLRVHEAADHVPALQGTGHRVGDGGAHVSPLSTMMLAAAPMAILVGVASLSAMRRSDGAVHEE